MSILDRFSLAGKIALVTGASSGLGAGFAVALADAGADVVLAARRQDRLEATCREVEQLGRAALAVQTDVTDPGECRAAVQAAVGRFGRLDVLVNNAGMGTAVPALRETPEEFRQVIEVNLLGAYWMAQAAAQVMPPGSAIVNIASVLGLVKSYLPQAAYAASKAGLIGLTRDLNQQWSGRRGIRVNAVAPGYFRSEMTEPLPRDKLDAFITSTSTLGRMGEQHELDTVVVFLASPASSYVAGVTLAIVAVMASVIKAVSFDAADALGLATFWAAALGSDVDEDSTADKAFVEAAGWDGPNIWFSRVPEGKTAKNRMHFDLRAPGPVAAEVVRLEELG